ncbi:fungal specific transcription factor domain-containing protein [Aspergillus clavatus NRRL 1]|uniref:Xylanolytic transcriptional activator regulatory domain-containing protein n=1 Tax=Aspergillus clavatus (strain ATCC 1007 / CBS 513.65 / DSM 816 / NCTC 3887 / NRRL 1 / QM 1276 / 107) TaxID=344612 RepID=A1CCY7_ASPCL|nr:uncharacterized protein ACLA_063630 [Aspergillus clavatus NRRL 1]EAW12394.1 hypothetical protein ACLA_063630 [Aspergillus clavatus NRRL 1]
MEGKNFCLKRRVESLENEIHSIRQHLPTSVTAQVGIRPDSPIGAIQTNHVLVEDQDSEICVRNPSEEAVSASSLEVVTDLVSVPKDGSLDQSKEDWSILLALYQKVRDCAPQDLLRVVNAIRSSTSPRSAAEYLQESALGQLSDAHVGLTKLATEYQLMNSMRLPTLCEEPIFSVPARPWTTITSSDRLVSHLLSLYFTWDYPCYNWFDQRLFLADMIGCHSRFCSQLLVNAVLAHACLYSYSLRRPWDRFKEMDMCIRFLSEAQRLRIADPQPSLTTVQALMVMNLTYNCLGKDKIGWSCLGAAIRMANELKLYDPLSPAAGAGYDRSDPWNRARAATAWGLFEWQAVAAAVVHEAPRVQNAPFYDIPLSDSEVLDQRRYWHPYPFRVPVYPSGVFSTSRARLELSVIINEVTKFILDAPVAAPSTDVFMSLHARLTEWLTDLRSGLQPSKDAPPRVFMMHLHYHLSVAGLCKPLLTPEIEPEPHPSVISISDSAKLATREIIFLFKQTFGWKSASSFLNHALCYGAFNAIPFAKTDDRWRRSLETCINGLWYISFSFPVCRYLLRAIQHALCAAGFVDTELSPEINRILRYFTRKVWKKSLLGSLQSQYCIIYDTQSSARTVEDLLLSVENLSLDDMQ